MPSSSSPPFSLHLGRSDSSSTTTNMTKDSSRPVPRRTRAVSRTLPDGSVAVTAPTTTISRVGPFPTQPPRAQTPIASIVSGEEADMVENPSTAAPPAAAAEPSGREQGLSREEMTGESYYLMVYSCSTSNSSSSAIIHMQRRTIERMQFQALRNQMRKQSAYPLPQPVFPSGSEYRIPCTRLILGLHYHTDERRDVNRFIWHEIQVSNMTHHF